MSRRFHFLLFLLAFAIRLSLVAVVGTADPLATAHHEHAFIARSIAEGRGFRFNFFGTIDEPLPTSQQAPMVPSLLAACYLLFGVESRTALYAMLSLQAAAGAVVAVCWAALCRQITGSTVAGGYAGALTAFYPPLAVASCHIQSIAWNLLWIALLLTIAVSSDRGRWQSGPFLFAVIAVAAIHTDPILGAVAGLLGLWLVVHAVRRTDTASLRRLVLAAVLLSLALAPWTIRNYLVHGRIILVKSSFWYVFWQGNNLHSTGTDKLPVDAGRSRSIAATANPMAALDRAAQARLESQSVDTTLPIERLRQLEALPSEIQRMDLFGQWAVAELRASPLHYVAMCVRRLRIWFWFDPTNPRSYLAAYRASYLLLLLLAAWSVPKLARKHEDWMPVALVAFALTLIHAGIITSARFRLPFELLMILPASCTIVSLHGWAFARLPGNPSRTTSSSPSLTTGKSDSIPPVGGNWRQQAVFT